MTAVMGSRERLWSIYGRAWGWPTATMTADADRKDLARHADEMTRNESFNYALFNSDETALLGCVYIDPPERIGADAEISWWVVDGLLGSEIEAALDRFVPQWVADVWPMKSPRYVGRDLSWSDWLSLDELADDDLHCRAAVATDCSDLAILADPATAHLLVSLDALKSVARGTWYVSVASVFAAGVRRITLLVASFNPDAQRLYEELGFQEWERRPFQPFPGSNEAGDWMLMVKDLAPT